MNEANIIGYKILVDSSGKLVTEKSIAEISKVKDNLTPYTYSTLQTIIRIVDVEFKRIHNLIETELDARSYKDEV